MLSASHTSARSSQPSVSSIPRQLFAGLLLIAIAWPTSWFGPSRLSEYTFFPLWLGYILTVDGLVERRTGTSLMRRSTARFVALFFVSMPLWWLFEGLNVRLGNWEYLYPRDVGFVERRINASVAFSTVVPALFETAELYRSTRLPRRLGRWIRIAPSRRGLLGFAALGVVMLSLTLAFPRQAFPLVWLGLYFLVDPVVHLLGGRTLSQQVARGRWDTIVALFCAGITCGFFWEMWNSLAMPKWVYHIPYVDQPKLFEMPLLGYGGYLPFALEVYAAVQTVNLLTRWFPVGFLRFDEIEE
nr:putative transporter [uncultured bacterium]